MAQTQANGGLAPVELDRYWADHDKAGADLWAADMPQCGNGVVLNWECVFDELGVAEDHWRYWHDPAWRLELNRAYNDKAETIVGRRLLNEQPEEPDRKWPEVKTLADVFEAKNVWQGNSWWLHQSAHGEDELRSLLDRVEKRLENLREFLLPPNWGAEKQRLQKLGVKPPLYRNQRGPVTFATSVYGSEDFLLLVLDNPDLAARFRDLILKAMLGIGRVLDEEAGLTPQAAQGEFYFADDNCCLMTPGMYELFGYPILKGIFDYYAPEEKHYRYQHSDSAMGHLLPILSRLRFKMVNFGPTVLAEDIRRHMPNTIIQGQLAPFTLSRNEERNIVLEFLRDFEMTRETRGLLFATAGSINNGSRLTSMRLVMSAIQQFGRY